MLTIKSNFLSFKDRQNELYTSEDLTKLYQNLVAVDMINFRGNIGRGFTDAIVKQIIAKFSVDKDAKIVIINDLSFHMCNALTDAGFKIENIYLAFGKWSKKAEPDEDIYAYDLMRLIAKSSFREELNIITLKEMLNMKHFDLIIANPPYGSIGANITTAIIDGLDFDEFVNLLPIKDICRDTDLIRHVIDTESLERGIFEDAAVTTAISTISKDIVNDASANEFLFSKQTKSDSHLYHYTVANALRKYDHFKQCTDCSLADLNTDHLGQKPVDVGFLVSHRESAHGHLPYSKTSPQYRWNVLHNLPPEELITIWSPRMQNEKTHAILILLPTKQERDNLANFIYSEDGFRFLSMQFDAMNSDFAQYWNVFPKVDWTHPWTVEEILADYGYTPDEIKEVMEVLKNYKYMGD